MPPDPKPRPLAVHLDAATAAALADEVQYRLAHGQGRPRATAALLDALLSAPECAPYADFPEEVDKIVYLPLTPAAQEKLEQMGLTTGRPGTCARAAVAYYFQLPLTQRYRS